MLRGWCIAQPPNAHTAYLQSAMKHREVVSVGHALEDTKVSFKHIQVPSNPVSSVEWPERFLSGLLRGWCIAQPPDAHTAYLQSAMKQLEAVSAGHALEDTKLQGACGFVLP